MERKRKLTDEKIKEICGLYVEEKILSPELGRMFGVGANTIRHYLVESGVEIKSIKIDIDPGDKFGRWTVIEEAKQRGVHRYFLCECSCSLKIRKEVSMNGLRSGQSKSCGCYSKEKTIMTHFGKGKDYTGQIFGRLTILYEVERDGSKFRHRQVMAQCSCDGNIKKYDLSSLVCGASKSCGCYNRETTTNQVNDYQKKFPLFCEIEELRDKFNGLGIEVKCKYCGQWFSPTPVQLRNRISAIERPQSLGSESNFYCSEKCKGNCPLYHFKSYCFKLVDEIDNNTPTQHELRIWREEVLRKQREEHGYNFCTKCQSTNCLRAHHIDPKKLEPFFALDPENGIVLCKDCHYDEGHKGECSTGTLSHIACK